MKRFLVALFATFALATSAAAGPPPVPSSAPLIGTTPDLFGGLNRLRTGMRFVGTNWLGVGAFNFGGTDIAETARLSYHNIGALSQVAACFGQNVVASGSEGTGTTPYIVRWTEETPLPQIRQAYPYYAAQTNQLDIVVGKTGLQCSPPVNGFIAAGSTFQVREFIRVSAPPTLTSATAVAGGALATSATCYKLTNLDAGGLESGPTAEQCATPAGGNLAIQLVIAPSTYTTATCVYRGATTAEKFMLCIPAGSSVAGQISFTDYGQITPTATAPPAQPAIYWTRNSMSGESSNAVDVSGAGTDVSTSTGAITGGTGPSAAVITAPFLVVGDDTTAPAYMCLCDSIGLGGGISSTTFGTASHFNANWFNIGFTGLNTGNFSIGGTRSAQLTGAVAAVTDQRMAATAFADYIIDNTSTNDLANSRTGLQIAADKLAMGKNFSNRGIRYVITTSTPKVTTTDNMLTIGNQTLTAFEAERLNYNNWIYNGMQVDGSGNPVLSGGTRTPYIYDYIDYGKSIEVNGSNVLTRNGGFWKVPAAAFLTGQIATGSPSTTSLPASGSTFTASSSSNPGLSGYLIKVTSGARSGQTAFITTNTSTTLTLLANATAFYATGNVTGLSGAMAAGDTFDVYAVLGTDGTHPGMVAQALMGADAASWQAAKSGPFGTTH